MTRHGVPRQNLMILQKVQFGGEGPSTDSGQATHPYLNISTKSVLLT